MHPHVVQLGRGEITALGPVLQLNLLVLWEQEGPGERKMTSKHTGNNTEIETEIREKEREKWRERE